MSTLLDTSVLAHNGFRRLDPSLFRPGFAVSVVTAGELEAAVLLAEDGATRASRLRTLSAVVEGSVVLDLDRRVAGRYAELRASVERRPSNDLWIAATALAHDLLLVTADERQAQLPLVRTALVT